MSIAALLVVAATFWGSHGFMETQQVTWDWGTCDNQYALACSPGFIIDGQWVGTYHITLIRNSWDELRNFEKCRLVIHEVGHAAFNFEHKDNTVMDSEFYEQPTPGICYGSPMYRVKRTLRQVRPQ